MCTHPKEHIHTTWTKPGWDLQLRNTESSHSLRTQIAIVSETRFPFSVDIMTHPQFGINQKKDPSPFSVLVSKSQGKEDSGWLRWSYLSMVDSAKETVSQTTFLQVLEPASVLWVEGLSHAALDVTVYLKMGSVESPEWWHLGSQPSVLRTPTSPSSFLSATESALIIQS